MNQKEYILAINQAINYIHNNIGKNFTVEDIANHCCFSKFYFNRIFKSIVNESIYSFTRRLKMEHAAFRLRTTKDRSITEIALEVGYSPSNFATAFKDYFGISASDYRKDSLRPFKNSYRPIVEYISTMKMQEDFFQQVNSKITIKKLPKMNVEYERFIGNYCDLEAAWEKFCKKLEKRQMIDHNSIFIGISYDDPLIVDEDRCIYDMCVKVDKIMGMNVLRIEEGLYACYKFYDKIENLARAYNEVFALWMPFTKYTIGDRAPLEIYQSPLDEERRMEVDICIAIK
ncbi:AraC family transcriptional regulator [Inediibacterium massiliense]|uniref:AraC family transcriptional regulator n=1 Tax=Inediibacterium massiliense TaxID=1658111 RepID=UPI0006B4702D|nr:GyrI-like domain-containing protein [Inediibacterium massiliense]